MKEKTRLRVIHILCIVSLLITFFSIQRTYAKYYEQRGTTYATNIKRWVINVNEINLHEETTLSNVMTPQFFYNPHMTTNGGNNDILVPGRYGYFDFLIDYTNVDVSFKFEFDIEQLNKKIEIDEDTDTTTEVDAHLSDFEVYGYAIVDADLEITGTTKVTDIEGITTLTKTNGEYDLSGITQQIDITATEKQKRVLVLFRWNDDTNNAMDNSADTLFAGETNTAEDADGLHTLLKYNVKITFTQTV